MAGPFKLKSGNTTPFALMGSSPVKSDDLYGLTLSADASTGKYGSDKSAPGHPIVHDPFSSANVGLLGSKYKTGDTSKTGTTFGLKGKFNILGDDWSKFNLSGKGGVTHYTGNKSQSEAFKGASNFARGYGKELFTDAEKSAYSSTKTMNPSKTNVFGGLNLSLGTDKYRGFQTKFDIGGGANWQTIGAHLKEKGSAGVDKVTSRFEDVDGSGRSVYHPTYTKGDKSIHGSSWQMGTLAPNYQIGDYSTTGGSKITSQTKEDTGIKTYKEKESTSKIKPYLNLSASHSFPFSSSSKSAIGTLSANYGTKYSPTAGFGGAFGIQKGNIGGQVGYKQGKGWFAGINLNIGNKKNK